MTPGLLAATTRIIDRSISDYLAEVERGLNLPPDLRQDVIDELSGHLADTVAALRGEGLDGELAAREALARLGRPDSLAHDLVRAHQTQRRLLAGIGGGVYAAGGAWITGIIIGFALASTLGIGITMLWALAARWTGLQSILETTDRGVSTAIFGTASWLAAFLAARALVRTSAELSRRPIRQLASSWALAGGVLLMLWVLFLLVMPLNEVAVAVELAIPLAFVLGALVGVERPGPNIPPRAVVIAVLIVLLPMIVLGAMSPVLTQGPISGVGELPGGMPDLHYDLVGPPGPADVHGADGYSGSDYGSVRTSGGPASLLEAGGWRDLRFEAWVSFSTENHTLPALDPSRRAPFAVAPAVREGDAYAGSFDLSHYRGLRHWTLFFTGVGPDGLRHRLGGGAGGLMTFRGSVWDWLTAPSVG